MIEKSKTLKNYSIPFLIVFFALAPISYLACKEYSLCNEITNQALAGNQIAIQILAKYEKPWKLDAKVVRAALDENEFAIQILGISSLKK